MPVCYLDGPEKAGKSTLAEILRKEHGFRVRHWGPVTSDAEYIQPLLEDIASRDLVVWDRGWASESVYAQLLGRDRRLGHDAWLGEWLYGRAVQAAGLRLMVLGPSALVLAERRTEDDLPVNPIDERLAFRLYAEHFGYRTTTVGTLNGAHILAGRIAYDLAGARGDVLLPPAYCGPRHAKIVVLGERRGGTTGPPQPGAGLPFTSRLTQKLGQLMGRRALDYGWTNAEDDPLGPVVAAWTVVACGDVAQRYAARLRGPREIVKIPHPSWLFRWGAANGQVTEMIHALRAADLLPVHPDAT